MASSNDTPKSISRDELIKRGEKRKQNDTKTNEELLREFTNFIFDIVNSKEHKENYCDFIWNDFKKHNCPFTTIDEQFIMNNLFKIVETLKCMFPGCKILFTALLKTASGKYYVDKNLQYSIGQGTKIDNSWLADIYSSFIIDWSEKGIFYKESKLRLNSNTGKNPTLKSTPFKKPSSILMKGFGSFPTTNDGEAGPAKKQKTSKN